MDYEFKDKTNDRKYFTIVPNYVLNHSDAITKALYLDIKRAAGENGLSFMTEETMCKKNGIGEKRLHKALKYLLAHKWIEFVGMTPSKTRPIKTYKVNDIWKKNIEFYNNKKIPSESRVSKDTHQEEQDTRQKQDKILVKSGGIRRIILKRTNKKNVRKKYSSPKDITPEDLVEISERYRLPLPFVKLQFEKMINWLEAKGKRYKNNKRGLMNWVLREAESRVERRQLDDRKTAIDASGL